MLPEPAHNPDMAFDGRERSLLRPLWFDAIGHDTAADYIVKGILSEGGLSMIYGPSGCGKSFLATDMALAVARNVAWFGRRVKGGGVLYVAAEGQHGFRKRISAYRETHLSEEATGVPFGLLPVPVNLLQGADASELVKLILERCPNGGPVRLVIVDTLARTLIGGDENDPQDMGRYVASLGAIQSATGAHVCVIHHTGKNTANGARGHSSLLAAVDTALEVTRDCETRTARVIKQKDGREGDEIAFELETVDLGLDDDGDAITSCTVRQLHNATERASPAPKLSNSQRRALGLLREAINTAGEQIPASQHTPAHGLGVKAEAWRRYCDQGSLTDSNDPDSKGRVFRRCRDDLIGKGIVGTWDGWVWVA